MRLGLLGDVHAEDSRLEAALTLFSRERVDRVLCVGDIVDGRGDVQRAVEQLMAAGALAVRGNHDRWLAANTMRSLPESHRAADLDGPALAWISALPVTLELDTPRGPLLLCHGVGRDDMALLRPHDEGYALAVLDELEGLLKEGRIRVVVAGHTHERMVRAFGDLRFVNAGTLRGEHACVAILDLSTDEVRFFDFAGGDLVLAEVYPLDPNVFPA